jgi:hypothetical protein
VKRVKKAREWRWLNKINNKTTVTNKIKIKKGKAKKEKKIKSSR